MTSYPLVDETYGIIGACFEVYNEKGCGFLEPIYHECLEIELGLRGIPFESKAVLALDYKRRPLRKKYEADFICYGEVILEIKAVSQLTDDHRAQLINYLNATKKKVGLLVNFGGHRGLEFERFVNEGRSKGPAMVKEAPVEWGEGCPQISQMNADGRREGEEENVARIAQLGIPS